MDSISGGVEKEPHLLRGDGCRRPWSCWCARCRPSRPDTAGSPPPGSYPEKHREEHLQRLDHILSIKHVRCGTSSNKELGEPRTHLKHVVPVCVEGCLGQLDDKHAVGAAGLLVQLGVGDSPPLLAWEKKEK